jgi:hypothetical protein
MSSDWKIYGIYENATDELIYIGRTSMSLENRWFYHIWKDNKKGGPVWKYIQENGVDKFHIDLLLLCKTREEWCEWERHLILELEPRFNKNIPGEYT